MEACATRSCWEAASWKCPRGHLPARLGSHGEDCQAPAEVEWRLAREGIPDQDSASALRSEVLSPMSLNAMLASRAIGLLRPLGWVLLLATPVTPWRDDVGTGVSAPGVICLQFPSLIKI